ncbi:MAG TPA: bifunctional phosphoribosylaminoimidazolecarboxamide formyltransferase/IMP cyclohydrolase, partial [Candidatus Norongarragalinales archaeon]|nr:bifunctional phosphoribosylaminoimidazolecarboxamide formyltransferase/IMP cyclohydrolase [Candidatus Norongarragalinales archaeon]
MAQKRALLSVTDKVGLVPFASFLHRSGWELIASGNTAKLLKENKIPVVEVSDFTGSPEMLDGRVKTLHPKVHGGILFRRKDPAHAKVASSHSIDLVCVNFYPFDETLKKTKKVEEIIESIDIGGPALVRSASKNFEDVIVATSPNQYGGIIEEMKTNGSLSLATKKQLAKDAFNLVAAYDISIANYFNQLAGEGEFPQTSSIQLRKIQDLRYGENPHQKAALYKFYNAQLTYEDLEKLNGKELSYNNILDIQAALELICQFKEEKENVSIIFKHTNPTGAGKSKSQLEAFQMAFSADSLSAYGGIVVFNRKVDAKTAQEIIKNFMEIVIAPDFEKEALPVLQTKKNLRVIKAGKFLEGDIYAEKRRVSITGGALLQTPDHVENELNMKAFKVPTKRKPTEKELLALEFAWKFMGHIKSNSVVFATAEKLIAVGAGQQSRVDSCSICIEKARRAKFETKGSVMASEAFFP